jgi:hypothetical protein
VWGMGWLIAGLFGLILLGGLVVLARRRGGHRRGADDTLVTELLGPREVAAAPARPAEAEADRSPVPPAGEEAERSPVPPAGEEAERSPGPPAEEGADRSPVTQATKAVESSPSGPDAEGDWLESQLAWITEWSQQMHQQIESAGRPGPDRTE